MHPKIKHAPFVLLDDSSAAPNRGHSLLFHSPDLIITANNFSEIPAALKAIDRAVAQGKHVAGWLSYEVAHALEPKLAQLINQKAEEPLIWMMVCQKVERLDSEDLDVLLGGDKEGGISAPSLSVKQDFIDKDNYARCFSRIQKYITAGDVYQINFTAPTSLALEGDFIAQYKKLRLSQPVSFGALINTGAYRVLSASPEQFVSLNGHSLTAKPMKGTASRGHTSTEDANNIQNLQQDEKSRAENLMIVDLIRNDLSRIAEPASVKVTSLFDVEKYPSLLQMTSTITAKAKAGLTPSALIKAMFPCGSVTGAPKIRAMEIIDELETSPRGIYCGAIGHFSPEGQWSLSVPIRTAILNQKGIGRVHSGSGIVADSRADLEYNECRLKMAYLSANPQNFDLLETMGCAAGSPITLLSLHMDRLEESTRYFNRPFDRNAVTQTLNDFSGTLDVNQSWQLRLLLKPDGQPEIIAKPMPQTGLQPVDICISDIPINSDDALLQHKTSQRGLYENQFNAGKMKHPSVFDVIMLNEQGLLTEGTFTNLFIERNSVLITPPQNNGLLGGVLRQHLLNTGKAIIGELKPADLLAADTIYIGNACRGLIKARLVAS